MTDAPRVSIILPTFNRAAVLPESVASVLQQGHRDFELLIVDDGSTDDTSAMIAARFGADPRIRLLRTANAGPAAARNLGLRAARGELIAFQDSDDLWLPEKLALQVRQADEHPEADLFFCDAYDRGGPGAGRTRFQGKGYRGDVSLRGIVAFQFPLCTPAVLVRRAALEMVGLFDPALDGAEDWDLWMRLLERFPAVLLDRPLVILRAQPDSLSRTRLLMKWRAMVELFTRHEARLLRADCPASLVRRRLAHAHRKLAQTCRTLGLREEARRHYLAWWRLQPLQLPALFWWMALSLPHSAPR
ncbi:MAG TPA: glycosyltransferase [Candidatus Polarisedimenticolia bacterium]